MLEVSGESSEAFRAKITLQLNGNYSRDYSGWWLQNACNFLWI